MSDIKGDYVQFYMDGRDETRLRSTDLSVAEIVEQGAGSMVIHCEIHQAGAVAAEIDFEFAEDTLDPESDPDIGGV